MHRLSGSRGSAHTSRKTQDTLTLNLSVNSLTTKLEYLITQVENRWATWKEVGQRLEAAETTIAWVEKLIVNLNLGLETLPVGKLPPQLFPPGRLERVLKEIILLPQGWMLNTASKEDQVWAIYRDARVTSALVEGKLRVSAEIPVTYQGNQFYSHRSSQCQFTRRATRKESWWKTSRPY
jgi:hypothetical protein